MPRESVDPARPIRPGNATLAEVHRDRFQSRASDGDGGRGVAVVTEAELAAQSNLHSGAWQRRAGARLAGKFLPRRQFIGYGRGRGEIVPEDSSSFEDDPPALPGPKTYVEDDDGVYLEQDPNLMEPSARAAWNENRRRRVLDEAAALAATRGLDGTVRVHSDSKTAPAENENHLLLRRRKLADGATPLRPLLTPCWAEIDPARGSDAPSKHASNEPEGGPSASTLGAPWATLGDVRADANRRGDVDATRRAPGRRRERVRVVRRPARSRGPTGRDRTKGEIYRSTQSSQGPSRGEGRARDFTRDSPRRVDVGGGARAPAAAEPRDAVASKLPRARRWARGVRAGDARGR